MPYIPQFNKLSFQEQAYAPTLMRQQHDEAVAKQMELADALKFDYLKQDASILEPVLNKYSEDINKVSTDLAKNGFTQDTKSKLLGLRSQYISDDKIRQVKKNYSDAMQGWEETKKALIQRGASGDLINKQKAAYFGAYKGGFDDEGFKQDFTAGRTSGVYDLVEDAKKAMTNLGQTGQIVGSSGSSIKPATLKDANGNIIASGWETTDNKTGQKVFNKDQRLAVEAYLNAEYNDESTDRGLYAKIAGLTPEHIQNAIANVSKSMAEDKYAQLPQQDINISGMTKASSSSSGFTPYTYSEGSGDPDVTKRTEEELSILDKPIPTDLSESEKAKIAEGVSRGGSIPNPDYLRSLYQNALQNKQKELAQQKQKVVNYYSNIYKNYYENADPIDATKRAIRTERDNNAIVKRRTAVDVDKKELGGVGTTQKVLSRIKSDFDGYTILKQDKNTSLFSKNGYNTPQDFIATIKDNIGWENQAVEVDNNADILLKDKNDNLVKINPAALQDDVATIQQNVLKPILQDATNPALFNGQRHIVNLPNTNIKYEVILRQKQSENDRPDLYNIKDRMIEMYVEDPSTGKKIHSEVMSVPDFKSELVRGMFQGFEPTSLGQ